MTDPAKFWDRMADRYSAKPVKDTESYETTLACTRRHLSRSHEVLEVGCGTGTTALLLAPGVKRILASDVSSRMIEIARSKALAEGVNNVRFEQGTLFDEALEAGSFDVVIGFNLLHLLEDLPHAVRRAHELLKPGGSFISKTACLAEQGLRWRVLAVVMTALPFLPSVNCLGVAELEGLITRTGFEIVETGSYPASPPSRFVVARKR